MQNMEKRRTWATQVVVTQSRRAGQGRKRRIEKAEEAKGRSVMDRICPRRPGVEWQERMWNRLKSGRANDERRQSLGASRSCRPTERNLNGHGSVLPSCRRGLRYALKMYRFLSSGGSPRT